MIDVHGAKSRAGCLPAVMTASLSAAVALKMLLVALLQCTAAAATAVDPCIPKPCARGSCKTAHARYSLAPFVCACPVGYSGVYCEIQSLVAPCFSSNMVLQSGNAKTSIYGAANATVAHDTITVTVAPTSAVVGSPFTATADSHGAWYVVLGSMKPSSAPMTLSIVSKSGAHQTLSSVLRGDVFVCSGQSNMALPVSSGYLPLTAAAVEAKAKAYPHLRLLNNGHFWPPTPSHPGSTALGKQKGDAPGWQLPSFGNGSLMSQGTVANFSATCYFMGTTIADYYQAQKPIGLISTDAGGTSIHRWVSPAAAAKCSQVTPTSAHSMGPDIGTLFEPMVLPLAKMAISGITWFQGEANECPHAYPVKQAGPCGGKYYACQLRAMIEDWRLHFVNAAPNVPFLVNELGALQDPEWPVLRQAMHQAVDGLPKAAVIANSDMGDNNGRIFNGLPSGAMHSRRKVNLGRRNGLAMLSFLLGVDASAELTRFAPKTASAFGPVLESATILKTPPNAQQAEEGEEVGNSYEVTLTFTAETATSLHFVGSACCTICCGSRNGSAIKLRVENASAPSGYSWQRTESPSVVSGTRTVTARFYPMPPDATVATDQVQFMYEGEPECALYNGVGGPDNGTAIAATAFHVSLQEGRGGTPALVPAQPCATMLKNGSCWFAPEPCSRFTVFGANGTHLDTQCAQHAARCCWDPHTNKGQCSDIGSPGCKSSRLVAS